MIRDAVGRDTVGWPTAQPNKATIRRRDDGEPMRDMQTGPLPITAREFRVRHEEHCCRESLHHVGSIGIRAMLIQAIGAPAFSAASAGGSEASQSAPMKRLPFTAAA